MNENSVVVRSWTELSANEVYEMARLRTNVFFVEQKVDEEELDGRDLEAPTVHMWIADEQGFAAYLRVLLNEHPEHLDARRVVGRVVTRADRRGQGLAHRLMSCVVERFGTEPLLLHAQSQVVPLYSKSGFIAFGDEYTEAGILHRSMYRQADAAPRGE